MPSTVISNLGYEPKTRILVVQFVSGLVYRYFGVPENVYEDIKTSRAKGIYLNKHIKGLYDYEKIEPV